MTFRISNTVRGQMLARFEGYIGAGPVLRWYEGPLSPTKGLTPSGTRLLQFQLPTDWLTNPTTGTANKVGTWEAQAEASGIPGCWVILSLVTFQIEAEGDIGTTGSGASMIWDGGAVSAGQTVTINTFTLVGGNN